MARGLAEWRVEVAGDGNLTPGALGADTQRTMPYDPQSLPPADAPAPAPMVMVIDDDSSIRSLMRRFLQQEGFAVTEAASGRAALDSLRQGATADYILSDLKMSDGSGGWLLAQIGYEFPDLLPHTVIVSGDADGAGAAHVSARWRCPVLAKPFTPRQLVAALERVGAQR